MHARHLLFALFLVLCPGLTSAQNASARQAVPHLMRFNGTLPAPSANDRALPAGKQELTFALYREQSGGEALWSEQQTVHVDSTGHYAAFLGAGSAEGLPVEVFASGQAQWLSIRVSGSAEQPRILLAAVPYAFVAHEAETLAGHAPSDFVTSQTLKTEIQTQIQTAASSAIGIAALAGTGATNYIPLWTNSTTLGKSLLYQSGTHIGIGTTAPTSPLEVSASTSGQATLLKLQNRSGFLNSTADLDFATSSSTGSFGRLSVIRTNRRIAGDTDMAFDVYSNSALKEGMRIKDNGIVGIGTSTPQNFFAQFAVAATSGMDGIYGQGNTNVAGDATNGITGDGGDSTSSNAGGFGGVFYGGYAYSGSGGTGLFASGGNSDGSGFGPAALFLGDVHVTGTLSAGAKSFMIDHPVDPANKYLVHASVESSEDLNIYTGNITTDEFGAATVKLPVWFEAENGDFRYQLTTIGRSAQVWIAKEVSNHQFQIATNATHVKVSWQITAVRRDAFAVAHPLVVEQPKDKMERGFYLHPELYGSDEEHQVEWARHPATMRQLKARRVKRVASLRSPTAPNESAGR